jgi:hypothetical protein
MIVFLDTGRVLPEPRDLQSLDAVLQDYPEVSIVITSGQRTERSLDELRAPFSRDVAARIVGVTPVIAIEGPADRPGSRHREILLYLDERLARRWVALDADETLFPPACENLILCDNGFDMFASMELQSKLSAALLASVPVMERNGRPFAVRLTDIPQPWQDQFRIALRGSACPVLDGEGELGYAWDWKRWIEGSFKAFLPRGY